MPVFFLSSIQIKTTQVNIISWVTLTHSKLWCVRSLTTKANEHQKISLVKEDGWER